MMRTVLILAAGEARRFNAIYTLVPDADYARDIDTPGNWNDARRDG